METEKKKYKVETHAHTAEVSTCGHLDGETLIRLYAESGYSTVFITDHFYSAFFEKQGDIDWHKKLCAYRKGYEAAKMAGEKYGVCVLWGAEMRLDCCPNDYLVYGLSEQFLETHEEILKLDLIAFSNLVRENGGLIVQAHPTRRPKSCPTPEFVDGFEVHNTNPRHAEHADYAYENELAEKYGLLKTGGSDTHRTEDVGLGGMAFPFLITSVSDYIRAVKKGEGCVL